MQSHLGTWGDPSESQLSLVQLMSSANQGMADKMQSSCSGSPRSLGVVGIRQIHSPVTNGDGEQEADTRRWCTTLSSGCNSDAGPSCGT